MLARNQHIEHDIIAEDAWFLLMQPPKRGLSLEEKRSKLLEVFHESKDVFVLKAGCMHACMRACKCRNSIIRAQLVASPAATSSTH